VAKVHPSGFHLDEHLPWTADRQLEGRESQRIKVTSVVGAEPQRHARIQPLLAPRPAATEALNISRLAGNGDFALGIIAEQLTEEKGVVQFGNRRRQVDPLAGEVRVLTQDDTQKPD